MFNANQPPAGQSRGKRGAACANPAKPLRFARYQCMTCSHLSNVDGEPHYGPASIVCPSDGGNYRAAPAGKIWKRHAYHHELVDEVAQ